MPPEQNFKMRFGSFSMEEVGETAFDHATIGSTADKVEARTAVLAVAFTADEQESSARDEVAR